MQTTDEKIELLTLQNFISSNHFIIPAFQRNYIWGVSVIESVMGKIIANLSGDMYRDVTIGMITVCAPTAPVKCELADKRFSPLYIIDGQQRVITLKLLFNLLCDDISDNPVNLSFDRDENIREKCRIDFINRLKNNGSEQPYSVDTERIKTGYKKIKELFEGVISDAASKREWIEKILSRIKILVHHTSTHPNMEFLNLNFNKNRFSLADYAKTYMIITSTNNNEPTSQIVNTFKNISRELYNEPQWDILKSNYKNRLEKIQIDLKNKVENRLDVLFEDKISVDKLNYIENIDSELKKLKFSLTMTREMFIYTNNQNGFLWLAQPKEKSKSGYGFYELIYNWFNDAEANNKSFKWFMLNTVTKESNSWQYLNGFLDVQLKDKRIKNLDELEHILKEFPKSWNSAQGSFYGNKPNVSLVKDFIRRAMETTYDEVLVDDR